MSMLPHASRSRLRVVPLRDTAGAMADDLKLARRRMRHLAPWHVEPLPAMHFAIGNPSESRTSEERERSEHVALRVLAVQMWQASATSAMD
jgi:hypothetical protein